MVLDPDTFKLAGSGVLALAALAYGLQKMLKGWKETAAEVSIIGLMHTELERMSKQNKALSEELNKLQKELIHLNTELQKLTLENQSLHTKVCEITKQLSKLKKYNERNSDDSTDTTSEY